MFEIMSGREVTFGVTPTPHPPPPKKIVPSITHSPFLESNPPTGWRWRKIGA